MKDRGNVNFVKTDLENSKKELPGQNGKKKNEEPFCRGLKVGTDTLYISYSLVPDNNHFDGFSELINRAVTSSGLSYRLI